MDGLLASRRLRRVQSTVMFEVKLQTYWTDADPAGIVYFSNFFRFVEQAEEELFRASGTERHKVLEENHIWMPRVEVFSKFLGPIHNGHAIRIRLTPELQGQRAIRYNFEILDDISSEKLAEGYMTIVTVDRTRFKAVHVPGPVRVRLKQFMGSQGG